MNVEGHALHSMRLTSRLSIFSRALFSYSGKQTALKPNLTSLLPLLMLVGLGAACGLRAQKETPLLFSGTIETREIRVGSKAGGRVAAVLVTEGQQVTPGQALIKLDVAELEAQKSQAEARIEQQQARLERLQRGARDEEKSQAHAATESARATLDAVRNGPRTEEVAQARASVAASEADLASAESAYARARTLSGTGDISKQQLDDAVARRDSLTARRDAERKRLEMLLNGSRPEDLRAAQERYRQAQNAERLVRAGARVEEIADARAQVREAQARLEQIRIQISEGEVLAPAAARVEVLPVRPGDLLTPNQPVARLLESSELWVRIFVPEPQLGLVRVGQKAAIKIDSFPNRSFDGVIEQINSQGEFTPRNVQSRSERNHQVFGVKVRIANPEGVIKSGMAADVTISSS